MDVLSWYVSEIENVMAASTAGDSWTGLWLDVLKKAAREGHYPEMPRFGFGDPKSYSTMKSAVTRLSHSGAVRHGAEWYVCPFCRPSTVGVCCKIYFADAVQLSRFLDNFIRDATLVLITIFRRILTTSFL